MKLRKLFFFLLLSAAQSNIFAQSADLAANNSSAILVAKSVGEKEKLPEKEASKKTEKGTIEAAKSVPEPTKSVSNSGKTTPSVASSLAMTLPPKDSTRRAAGPIADNAIVQNVSVLNGDKDDFSPIFFENGLLYCSNSRKVSKKTDKSTVVDDLNLKFATFDSLGNLSKPSAFSRRTNSKTHEGPSCFSSKGDTMFLTRVMSKGGIAKYNKEGETTLKIYIKVRDTEGNFLGEMLMPFESETYSYCHPTMSADGKRLYFASNMPGGFGGMDLWMTRKLKNGEWSQAMNLGSRINTSGNELFPHITENGAFYFSSNGRKDNKGGLDIYHVDIENKTSRVFPMSESFNTEGDDFGIMFLPSSERKGYFSSSRKGGSGGDDIYEFEFK
jgi:WD40-like Beta Propeller Repeat